MQEDKQTKFDSFIKDQIKNEGLEEPSFDFTHAVISKIESQKVPVVEMSSKPLIPKYIWYAGAALVLALFSYLIYGNVDVHINWLPEVKIQELVQFNLLEKLPSYNVSSIYVYAFIGLAFFVGVQVYLLKNHFDKRYFID